MHSDALRELSVSPSTPLAPNATGAGVLLMKIVAVMALEAIGCAGSAIRSQSPEIEALVNLEADTKLVGDYAGPWGLNTQHIERAALITGLAGTGSDPPPNAQRQKLMADMQARGVVEPNNVAGLDPRLPPSWCSQGRPLRCPRRGAYRQRDDEYRRWLSDGNTSLRNGRAGQSRS